MAVRHASVSPAILPPTAPYIFVYDIIPRGSRLGLPSTKGRAKLMVALHSCAYKTWWINSICNVTVVLSPHSKLHPSLRSHSCAFSYSHDISRLGEAPPSPFHVLQLFQDFSPLLYKWQHTSATSLAAAVKPPPLTEKPRHVAAQSRLQAVHPSTFTHLLRPRHRRQRPERHELRFSARTATITPLLWFHHLFVIRPMIRVIPTKIAARPPIGLRTQSHLLK